jgi:transcription initiation factor TFIIH subunit 1
LIQDSIRQIDLDDLHDPEAPAGITLDMHDRQRYFDGRMSNSSTGSGAAKVGGATNVYYRDINHRQQNLNIPVITREIRVSLQDWNKNLTEVRLSIPSDLSCHQLCTTIYVVQGRA